MSAAARVAAFALAAALPATPSTPDVRVAAPAPAPTFARALSVTPRTARVFVGGSLRFRAALAGSTSSDVAWSVLGPGGVDRDGIYVAGNAPGSATVIARVRGLAAAAAVDVVAPPPAGERLALISCFDDSSIEVRDASSSLLVGGSMTAGGAAGIAADPSARRAAVAAGDRLAVFDARSAAIVYSTPIPGARFSEVALLRGGYAAVTDNLALAGQPGIRVFRLRPGRSPVLIASADAGETPEGIVASRDGRTLWTTAINSDRLFRFTFDGGSLARSGSAATGHRPFGVAVDERLDRVLVADNDTPTVSGASSRPGLEMFDGTAMRRVARADTGSARALPLGVVVDPRLGRAFVTNEGDGTVAAFSLAPLRRVATIAVGRTPWLPALDAARRMLFVPDAGADAYAVIDARTLRVAAPRIDTCRYPTSIGIL